MCVELAELTFRRRKNSRTGADPAGRVEFAVLPSAVGVRDSKDPEGPKLVVSRRAFGSLVGGIKRYGLAG